MSGYGEAGGGPGQIPPYRVPLELPPDLVARLRRGAETRLPSDNRPPMSPYAPTVIDATWDGKAFQAQQDRERDQIKVISVETNPVYTIAYRWILIGLGFASGVCATIAVMALVPR